MPKRVDRNQPEIVKCFRDNDCSVWITSDLGHGGTDIVVGMTNRYQVKICFLVEIKDGEQPPSRQRLTADEEKFHANWKGMIFIIRSKKEALDLIEQMHYIQLKE
jgi:hypothetical protein